MQPKLIPGGIHKDKRGMLQFLNDFDMSPIKRMYVTTHHDTKTIRAWMGHKIESRWFFCTRGAFIIRLVAIGKDDSPTGPVRSFQLKSSASEVLFIPPGYASGFKAEEEHSSLLIMADYGFGEIDDTLKFSTKEFLAWK
ncbi:WxcM-like domain-containing protein [Luteirhabdus pelagi]|uniref:WxcM-like domain-containing protein n=1 Tax=Luteirhabdus pelagi TaxID=2792783 RepID=UPI0021D302FA|nr:WxcM-like domain-containing protein [Luteirhabdus pelagi]